MSLIANATNQPAPEVINQADTGSQTNTTQTIDWEKRYKDLQSYSDKTKLGLQGRISDLEAKASVFTPPKTAEELEVFKGENPDWMGVIETVAHNMAASSIQDLTAKVHKAEQVSAAEQLRAAHPDFAEIYQSEQFKAWASAQDESIQNWIKEENDAAPVIRALNYYKAMNATVSQQTQAIEPNQYQENTAANAVSTSGSVVSPAGEAQARSFTVEEINAMHPDVYEQNAEAINIAHKAGLIRQ